MTGSLQIKNDKYYAVINYYEFGKRKQKWVTTGLSEKGNNKRLANQKMQEILADFKESLSNQNSNTNDRFLTAYLKEWLLSVKNTIEEKVENIEARLEKKSDSGDAQYVKSVL